MEKLEYIESIPVYAQSCPTLCNPWTAGSDYQCVNFIYESGHGVDKKQKKANNF